MLATFLLVLYIPNRYLDNGFTKVILFTTPKILNVKTQTLVPNIDHTDKKGQSIGNHHKYVWLPFHTIQLKFQYIKVPCETPTLISTTLLYTFFRLSHTTLKLIKEIKHMSKEIKVPKIYDMISLQYTKN